MQIYGHTFSCRECNEIHLYKSSIKIPLNNIELYKSYYEKIVKCDIIINIGENMTNFEVYIREFDDKLYELKLDEVQDIASKFFKELVHHIHCDGLKLEIIEDEESYLYKMKDNTICINFNIIKHFQKFAHLFLLDTMFIVARTLMQRNFKNTLKERDDNQGQFFVVEDNSELPLNYADIFRLDNVMLLYCNFEKDKESFHSVSMFDRRAFAYACMENYIKLVDYKEGQDYLNYLKEDFTLCAEDAKPETPLQLEDNIVAKFKSENQLGFLEEMELREKIYKQIENVLGE